MQSLPAADWGGRKLAILYHIFYLPKKGSRHKIVEIPSFTPANRRG
ncbi:MAG: hypothetical protein LBR79_03930 [Oscillospiraceae bacterium]|nr:hypothetical protein [Oscillospiraceae bacterium]